MRYALAIETSCDETAIAVGSFASDEPLRVLSERISSQVALHQAYGGVVPELAAREHLAALPILCEQVMRESGVTIKDLACIGVTIGPGLKGCLLMGAGFAKGIAAPLDIPLLGINHLEGHVAAALLDNPDLNYPFLALIVSGGHTQLYYCEDLGCFTLLARTLDDAAGEAFDKAAYLLGLDYPGGARLAALAETGTAGRFTLPVALPGVFDMSFSGLKTAVSVLVHRLGIDHVRSDQQTRADVAYAIQEAIVRQLVQKTVAVSKDTGCRTVVVTGGVAANRALRARLEEQPGLKVLYPTPQHCTDNGAMILYATVERFKRGEGRDSLPDVRARWPLTEIAPP